MSCPVCKHSVSSHAPTCPNCGHPVQPQRKISILTQLGTLCLLFAIPCMVVGRYLVYDPYSPLGPMLITGSYWGSIAGWVLLLAGTIVDGFERKPRAPRQPLSQ